jgi:DNA-binding transcriptional LysR family regulator
VQRHPGVDVSLQIHNRRALIARMTNNEDELYVFANPPADCEIVRQVIFPNPMVVFACADHPLVRQRSIPLSRVAREPFLMREPGSGTRMVVQELCARHGLVPAIRMELSTNEIKHGDPGWTGVDPVAPYPRTDGAEPAGNVGRRVSRWSSSWHFVYPIGRQLSPAAKVFMAATHAFSHGAMRETARRSEAERRSEQQPSPWRR